MIYFDNASSTKIDAEVLTTYYELLENYYANPSSSHSFAMEVQNLVELSRTHIRNLFGINNAQIIFTSGATEANNLLLQGYYHANFKRGNKIIISAGEHPSVKKTCESLVENFGAELVQIPLLANGSINFKILSDSIDDKTSVISIMAVNNETGAVNNIDEISALVAKYPKAIFHSDVTQAVGKINLNYARLDAFSFSAHKFHGLKGSGALVLNKQMLIKPLFEGGGQEQTLRSGTLNAPVTIALAKTLRLAMETSVKHFLDVQALALLLTNYLNLEHEYFILNSDFKINPYIINFSLKKHKASVVVNALTNVGIMVSSTSSCNEKLHEISQTVFALSGGDKVRAENTIRVSFSHFNTTSEVEVLIKVLGQIIKEIKHV